jgi:hypothetical protein
MPWTTPETFTAGQTLTAASMNLISDNLNALPRGYVAHVASTTLNQTFSANADVTGMSVSATVAGDRRYRISANVPSVERNGTLNFVVQLQEDGTTIQHARWDATNIVTPCALTVYRTPTAGTKTYKLRVAALAGVWGSVVLRANADTGQALILIEDIGPA